MHCTLDLELSPEIIHGNSFILRNLLAKATVTSHPAVLAALRYQQAGISGNCSIAAIAAKADGLDVAAGVWLLADPVNLVLQRDAFSLYPEVPIKLSRDEANDYQSLLNQHFTNSGIKFYLGISGQWYVNAVDQSLSEHTQEMIHPVHAMGQSVETFMPKSAEANQWLQVQNEVQMLLFECEISQAREQSGLLPVNSVWFYGAGESPADNSTALADYQVVSNTPFYQGLAQLNQTAVTALPETESDFESLLRQHASSKVIVELTQCSEWEDFLAVCANLLKQRVIKHLSVQLGQRNQTLIASLKPLDHLRFWRKSHPLTYY